MDPTSEFCWLTRFLQKSVNVKIEIPEGIRPVRVPGNSADINGQSVMTQLSQVYSDQQKHVVIEVEIPADLAHAAVDSSGAELTKATQLAIVSVTYMNMVSEKSETLTGEVSVSFSSSARKSKPA